MAKPREGERDRFDRIWDHIFSLEYVRCPNVADAIVRADRAVAELRRIADKVSRG